MSRLNAASYGRPMMISDSQFDTKPLSPLNDADLKPGYSPPSYPPGPHLKDTTYATCKLALSHLLRRLMASLFGITPPSYDQILQFDADVRATYAGFPASMQLGAPFPDGADVAVV